MPDSVSLNWSEKSFQRQPGNDAELLPKSSWNMNASVGRTTLAPSVPETTGRATTVSRCIIIVTELWTLGGGRDGRYGIMIIIIISGNNHDNRDNSQKNN